MHGLNVKLTCKHWLELTAVAGATASQPIMGRNGSGYVQGCCTACGVWMCVLPKQSTAYYAVLGYLQAVVDIHGPEVHRLKRRKYLCYIVNGFSVRLMSKVSAHHGCPAVPEAACAAYAARQLLLVLLPPYVRLQVFQLPLKCTAAAGAGVPGAISAASRGCWLQRCPAHLKGTLFLG